MNSGVAFAGMLIGGVVGFLAGYVGAVTQRGWADVKGAKAEVVKRRKAAWGNMWDTVKVGALALAVVITAGWWLYRDVADHKTTPLVPATERRTP